MVQRYNPDYVMHAARFAPFAREAEHGEFVKFSDYEALVSELASSRQINAQTLQVKLGMADTIKELTDRVNALVVDNKAQADALSLISCCYKHSPHIQSMCVVETPATDAALAAIEARGVEKFADAWDAETARIMKGAFIYPQIERRESLSKAVRQYLAELREAK
ncbi:TPA: hypothetical protein ACXJGQ_000117 [Serratia marcescens]